MFTYYLTRVAHQAVVTSDWLAQAQAAVGRNPNDDGSSGIDSRVAPLSGGGREKVFSVIDEFNSWRKQPDLAKAVTVIFTLAAVIKSSQATTMMELEIELKKASDSFSK